MKYIFSRKPIDCSCFTECYEEGETTWGNIIYKKCCAESHENCTCGEGFNGTRLICTQLQYDGYVWCTGVYK